LERQAEEGRSQKKKDLAKGGLDEKEGKRGGCAVRKKRKKKTVTRIREELSPQTWNHHRPYGEGDSKKKKGCPLDRTKGRKEKEECYRGVVKKTGSGTRSQAPKTPTNEELGATATMQQKIQKETLPRKVKVGTVNPTQGSSPSN